MMTDNHYVCLVTSGRVFELAYGGEERFTSLLAEWLVRHRVGVILMAATFASVKSKILTIKDIQENKEYVLKDKKNVKILNPPYLIYLGSRLILSFFWMLRIMLASYNHRISLIHSQDTGYSGLAAIMAGKLLKIPVLLTSHGVRHKTLESSLHGRLRNFILKIEYALDLFTVRNASKVIAVNLSIKEYLEKLSGREIDFLPICIKTNEYRYSAESREQIRRELGLDNDAIVIGFVGRFSGEKNLDTLLASFANAVQTHPKLKLILVGTGFSELALRSFIEKRGIEENVIFCGIRYDIPKILCGMDIFILPSLTEGLSTSLLEAIACGRAVICSDIEANRSIITHGENGLLVNPRNVQQIQQAIESLYQDQSLRSRLGSFAELTASHYDENLVLPKLLQTYSLLSGVKY